MIFVNNLHSGGQFNLEQFSLGSHNTLQSFVVFLLEQELIMLKIRNIIRL
jgi:hypothetical protein